MSIGMALQNMVLFGLPVLIYVLVMLWRARLSGAELRLRLGLTLGGSREYLLACVLSVPLILLVVWITPLTSTFKGSTIAPFVGASPTLSIITAVFIYGVLGTGFPEELLFRGLIAGAIFRRTSFWKANLIQAVIFMLPHLLILLVASRLWPLAIGLPLALGLLSGWLRQTSGSIWPSVIIHAVPNMAGALAVMNWRG